MDLKGNISYRASLNGTISGNKKLSAKILRGGGGVKSYNDLTDKPSINNETVEGDKNGHDYGLANLSDIPSIPVYNLIKTNLWNYATDNNNNIIYGNWDVTLHDDIDNYDIIILEVASFTDDMNPGSAWNGSAFITIFTHMLNNAYYPNRFNICTYDNRSTNIELKDNRCRVMITAFGNINGLISIWGVKLGAIV